MSGKLTDGFREIIELKWSDFVYRENAEDATNFDSIITALVRACAKGNLRAIQTALDRLDGKIATEIEVEYPRFYTLYPRATKTVDAKSIIELPISPNDELAKELYELSGSPADLEELAASEEDAPTIGLRSTLEKMLDSPKEIVTRILEAAAAIDKNIDGGGDPSVKAVVVAGLMKMVHDGRLPAVLEVFDQIDGKVADTYKLLGGDVYMQNYALIAPAGAVKNEDGIYQTVADNTTNVWAARLEQANKKVR